MKKTVVKALSLLLTVVLFAGLYLRLPVQALDTPAANITEAKFSLSEYDTTYDAGAGTYWKIELTGDQDIAFGTGNYWKLNLQQYMVESQSTAADNWEEHNALADILREKIYINDVPLKDNMALDPANKDLCVRVMTGDKQYDATKRKLYIFIRSEFVAQKDNTFGVNDYSDFTLEFKEGVTLNGFKINPVKYKFSSRTQEFIIDDGTFSVAEQSVEFNKSYKDGIYHLFTFKTDMDLGIENGEDLQNREDALATALRANIQINGKSIEQGLADATDHSMSTRISTGLAENSDTIYVAVKANDNAYAIAQDKAFKVGINDGIIFNDYKLNAVALRFSTATQSLIVDDGSIEFTSAALSSVTSYVTGGTERGPCWVITLTVPSGNIKSNIIYDSMSSYWSVNLQQYMLQSQGQHCYGIHNAQADLLRKNILINDISVDKALVLTNPCATSFATPNDKTLKIYINKDKDKYTIGDTKNFKIEFKEGIKLGTEKLSPMIFEYSAVSKTFSVKNGNAVPEPPKTSEITGAAIESVTSYLTGGTERGPCWLITLTATGNIMSDIIYDSSASYWKVNLQQPMSQSQGANCYLTHSEQAKLLRDKIIINGVSVDKANSLTDACATSIATPDSNHIRIYLNKAKDQYGVGLDKDFVLELKPGIVLNSYTVSPYIISYTAATGTFKIEENSPQSAVTSVKSGSLTDETNGMWTINLNMDQDISVNGGVSGDLQFVARQRTDERKALADAIVNNLTINGESLAESLERAGHHYTARVSASGEKLMLKISKKTASTYDNDFYISDKTNFTVAIKNEIEIAGVKVQPSRWQYTAETGEFTRSDGEDVKHIGHSLLNFTGMTREETNSNGDKRGILLWSTGTSRYADFYLDCLIRGTSLNSEAINNEHGESTRKYIYVDGMSIDEWIEYGNQYQVMVRFEGNYIRLLLDGSRMPDLTEDEAHWVEFRSGLISATGESIAPCKFYYAPATGVWTVVDNFNDCEKPWWLDNYEKQTARALAGWATEPSYERPQYNWADEAITDADTDGSTNIGDSVNEIIINQDNNTQTENDQTGTTGEKKKVVVKERKKVASTPQYVDYLPIWAVVLIIAGAVIAVGGIILWIILAKKKKARLIKADQ
ncbi:MAG: hypothetical protein PHR14_08370 [Oscillospiraceae bacterium]|nr:hypothetical protein [Oscillospiraceae bacterium]